MTNLLVRGHSPIEERNAVPQVLEALATRLVGIADRHERSSCTASATSWIAVWGAAGQISETPYVAHFINLVEN